MITNDLFHSSSAAKSDLSISAPFLTQGEAAALLRLSGRTLERHRVCGTGPAFVRLGRRIVYRPRDLLAWAEAHTYRSTSEASA